MQRPPNLPADIADEAILLDRGWGTFEDAWTRASVRTIVEFLRNTDVVILGGDVMRRDERGIRHTYDSWHYNPNAHDAAVVSVSESHAAARDYVDSYPDPEDGTILFVLVFRDPADETPNRAL